MSATDPAPLLLLDGISKRVGTKEVLKGINLHVGPQEIVCIAGERGAGKRRLLDVISGADQADGGTIHFRGVDVTSMPSAQRNRLGMVSSVDELPLLRRVQYAIREPTLEQRLSASLARTSGRGRRQVRERVEQVISFVGLPSGNRRASELSGGQRQRALLAELLIKEPELILLDEPFKVLDAITTDQFMFLIQESRSQMGISFLFTDRSGHGLGISDRNYELASGELHSGTVKPKIFLNYRRSDDPGFAQALFQRLAHKYSASHVFMDVEGQIRPGDDFTQSLSQHVLSADVLLTIIGPRWLADADDTGRPRLENPNDWVRIEIVSAFDHGKRVIPVLVGGASMPREQDLPEVLRPLCRRQAVRIAMDSFGSDVERLFKQLEHAT